MGPNSGSGSSTCLNRELTGYLITVKANGPRPHGYIGLRREDNPALFDEVRAAAPEAVRLWNIPGAWQGLEPLATFTVQLDDVSSIPDRTELDDEQRRALFDHMKKARVTFRPAPGEYSRYAAEDVCLD